MHVCQGVWVHTSVCSVCCLCMCVYIYVWCKLGAVGVYMCVRVTNVDRHCIVICVRVYGCTQHCGVYWSVWVHMSVCDVCLSMWVYMCMCV